MVISDYVIGSRIHSTIIYRCFCAFAFHLQIIATVKGMPFSSRSIFIYLLLHMSFDWTRAACYDWLTHLGVCKHSMWHLYKDKIVQWPIPDHVPLLSDIWLFHNLAALFISGSRHWIFPFFSLSFNCFMVLKSSLSCLSVPHSSQNF